MPTLFVVVETFGCPPVLYDSKIEDEIVAELNAASLGKRIGSGGTDGFAFFGYKVQDEAAARGSLARAMTTHSPGTTYHVRVREDVGCQTAFSVIDEFAARPQALQRVDAQPLGTLSEVQALIRRSFPAVQFRRTLDGAERIRSCEEQRLPISPEVRRRLEGTVSEWEGVVEDHGFRVRFGLGHREPVILLEVTPLGTAPEMERGLARLEAEIGARLFELSPAGNGAVS